MRDLLKKSPPIIFSFLLILALLGQAQAFRTNIKVKIRLAKEDHLIKEPIKGKVVFDNRSAATARAVFIIKLYFKDELYKQILTEIPTLLPGKNRYSFAELGSDLLKQGLPMAGEWRLKIVQQDVDGQHGDEVLLNILPLN